MFIFYFFKIGILKCNCLILVYNYFFEYDISNFVEIMEMGVIRVLDILVCGLDDMGVRRIVIDFLMECFFFFELLMVVGNYG